MKLIISEIVNLTTQNQERNVWMLVKFFAVLTLMVIGYSILFHFLMVLEDREFSWITGFYWTLTVMSTLGFGDITFSTDLGKLFSIIVLMSGIVFLLTMLPFTFIQFFYLPWLDAQTKAKAPRELPEGTKGHVILCHYDPLTISLTEKLRQYHREYVILVEDVPQALELQGLGLKVVVGGVDDPQTYLRSRVGDAALVVANVDDMMNANIASTIREISQEVPIAASADLDDSVDILELAGSTHVFQFTKMLGQSLARRVLGTTARANVIGQIESLLIAEIPAMRTALVGMTLRESRLRETIGINVIGVWERGRFSMPTAQTIINSSTVLLLAGSAEQFSEYDRIFGRGREYQAPVLVLGGGRVGQAAANALAERNIEYRIVERKQGLISGERHIHGSAADIGTLTRAGIHEAPSVIVTTHDDPTNIYLTIYCRKLAPDIQIISRANLERNVSKLHSAGSDLVMSYASIATNTILNLLKPDEFLMLAEDLDVFRVAVPRSYVGKTLAESQIRSQTGCNVIAVYDQGLTHPNPRPDFRFGEGSELILIGSGDAEGIFLQKHKDTVQIKR